MKSVCISHRKHVELIDVTYSMQISCIFSVQKTHRFHTEKAPYCTQYIIKNTQIGQHQTTSGIDANSISNDKTPLITHYGTPQYSHCLHIVMQ